MHQKENALAEARMARLELLSLSSWYNEISCRDPRFDELVYRILAAERYNQYCLRNLREHGFSQKPAPFLPYDSQRGVTLDGCWHGF